MSLLGAAPWKRAPVLLWRHPGVVAAVVGAAAILGSAGASLPLFVSSAGSGAVAIQVAQRCRPEVGQQVWGNAVLGRVGADQAALARRSDQALAAAGAHTGDLAPAVVTLLGGTVRVAPTAAPARSRAIQLVFRTGGLHQVQRLAGGGSGLWLTDTTAGELGLGAGQSILLTGAGPPTAVTTTRVAGIYRSLGGRPPTPFWCSLGDIIGAPDASVPPPPLALADRATLLSITASVGDAGVGMRFERSPVVDRLSLSQTRRVVTSLALLPATRGQPGIAAAATLSGAPGSFVVQPSQLPFVAERASQIQAALRSAVEPVVAAGVLVALALLAAAGSYWVDRRRVELDLLASKGVGPWPLAGKAVLEMGPPALAGGVLGWAAARGLVAWLGPSAVLEAGAPADALGLAEAVVALSILALALVVGARLRPRAEGRARSRAGRGRWPAVPWELAVLAGAGWTLDRLLRSSGTGVATIGSQVPAVSPLLAIFPLLFLVGTIALASRAGALGIPWLRRRGTGWPTSLYLATRRLAGAPRVGLLLVGATGLSIGVLVYASALTLTEETTLSAKAHVFVGSNVSLDLVGQPPVPAGLAASATEVDRYSYFSEADVDGQPVDVLAVDPATFARGAFFEPSFAAQPLTTLLADLAGPPTTRAGPVTVRACGRRATGQAGTGPKVGTLSGGHSLRFAPSSPALRVLVAGGRLAPGAVLSFSGAQAYPVRLALDVVGTAAVFPGEDGPNLLVVADQAALGRAGVASQAQLWSRGQPGPVLAAASRAGLSVPGVVSAADVLDLTDFAAVSWTFAFLQSLGILTGLITVGGLLLWLETRQRSRNVGYALARRMGLSRGAHWRSVGAELGLLLVTGFALGASLAWAAAALVQAQLDPSPANPPLPLLVTPVAALVGTAVAVAMAWWLATAWAQRGADRARAAQVLRADA